MESRLTRSAQAAAGGRNEVADPLETARQSLLTPVRRRPPRVELPTSVLTSGQLAPFMAGLAREHGPIFSVPTHSGPLAGRRAVYLVGPDASRLVFVTHAHCFSHEFGWSPIFGPSIGKGLINMDPPEHLHFRAIMAPAFTRPMMIHYSPVIERVIRERTRDWADRAEVDLVEECRRITFDVAAATLLGMNTGAAVDLLRERFYALVRAPATMGTDGHDGPTERAAVDRELRALLAARRRAGRPTEPPGVLDLLLHGADEDGRPLSDAQLLGHIDIILLAGYETTTNLAAWTLYLLASHRTWSDRVDAELARAEHESRGGIGNVAPILTNVVREAGRLQPPVGFVPRVAMADFEFSGYVVPAGTPVLLCVAASHRLSDLFTDPDAFDPDRLAPPREEQRQRPYALTTFGAGPRTCLGVNLAQTQVKMLAAHVQRHFRLVPCSGEVQQIDSVVQCLPAGLRVRVQERERA